MSDAVKPLSGKRVFLYFFVFFGVIVAVNAVFITKALQTHSGVVTERPYEKGLAYNETLKAAREQPDIVHEVSYREGVLRWKLPMQNAEVIASMVRSVQDVYDYEIPLEHIGGGVYEAVLKAPLAGAWTAKLKAKWDSKQFQTSYDFIVR